MVGAINCHYLWLDLSVSEGQLVSNTVFEMWNGLCTIYSLEYIQVGSQRYLTYLHAEVIDKVEKIKSRYTLTNLPQMISNYNFLYESLVPGLQSVSVCRVYCLQDLLKREIVITIINAIKTVSVIYKYIKCLSFHSHL